MTTKEEILALAGECGIQNDYISEDQAVEAFYYAARKDLEEQYASMTKSFFDVQAQLREALAVESKWRVEATALRQKLAEKDAEIERLKEEVRVTKEEDFPRKVKAVANNWKNKLAEAQLQIKQYREALENCRLLAARHRNEEWAAHVLRFCGDAGVIGSPIRNTDTTTLESYVTRGGEVMRERCAMQFAVFKWRDTAKELIRALPGVTLADLKGAE